MTDRRIVVLIADHHTVTRLQISAFLAVQNDISVCGQATSSEEALTMAVALKPDVVLMDLLIPAFDGIGAITRIGIVAPTTRVIVLAGFADEEKVIAAIRAGAAGHVMKDVPPRELTKAIRMVHAGESVLSPEVARRVMDEVARPAEPRAAAGLTRREHGVLKLVAGGLSNKEIADNLTLSEETVKTHARNILQKLHLSDMTQAASYAVRRHLVEPHAIPSDHGRRCARPALRRPSLLVARRRRS